MCLSIGSLASAASMNLTDVETSSRYYKSVSVFMTEDIIQGYEDGTFKPNKEINRAEALKIILEAFKLENNAQSQINFSDVSGDDWFAKYVAVGLNEGIVKGYNDGSFKPGNQVNFVEALKMALEAKGIETTSLVYTDVHGGISSNDWYSGFLSFGYDKNLFDVNLNGEINPGQLMTRGDFTEMVYRVRSLPTNGEFDISYNWKGHTGRTAVDVSFPIEWKSFDFGGNGVLIGDDYEAGSSKISFLQKDFNESRGLLYITGINEDLDSDDYLSEVKNGLGEGWSLYEEAKLDGKFLIASDIDNGQMNFYYWVDNGKVIIGEARFNGGIEKKKEYEKIYSKIFRLTSASDSPGVATIQERLNEVRKALLVEGKGMETIDLFADKKIIETDVVGVGTGPVDYYFVPLIDYTLKYEREGDVILDIMEGETIDF
jgi:predicted DNA-binding antitoxin AbrB/MazE fold protein